MRKVPTRRVLPAPLVASAVVVVVVLSSLAHGQVGDGTWMCHTHAHEPIDHCNAAQAGRMAEADGTVVALHYARLDGDAPSEPDTILVVGRDEFTWSLSAYETNFARQLQAVQEPVATQGRVRDMINRAFNGGNLTQRRPGPLWLRALADLTHPLYHPAFLDAWFFPRPILSQPGQPP
jgi:hypothetical protein